MKFRILGSLEVVDPHGTTVVRGRKRRGLLAYLLVHAGEAVSLDRVVEDLWDERPSLGARGTVQTYLSQLRKLVADSSATLETRPSGYVLDVPADRVDARCFERLCAEAATETDATARLALLDEALGLWRGAPLGEFAGSAWADVEATRLEAVRLEAFQRRIAARLELGRDSEAIPELERLVGEHSLDEHFWAQLIVAYYRSGRQADALRAYQRARSLLADELGVDPGAELQDLERRILDHDPELMLARPARVSTDESFPEGVVTFLLTDIEGSTSLWDEDPEAMSRAIARYEEITAHTVGAHGGRTVKSRGEGDSTLSVFLRASDAPVAAVALQRALVTEEWPSGLRLATRVALHTGEAHLRDGDYYGGALNRAARIRGVATGGQILCSRPTRDLIADTLPDEVRVVELGTRALRGLQRPETIYAVVHPEMAGEFAPLRSLDALAGNVPLQTSSFIGREHELAGLVAALREVRVVTLTGVGGVGKTRLARQVAGELQPGFRDGAWWCELAPVRDRGGVAEAVAGLFSVTARAAETVEEALVEFLRHKELLLVLDNCEHLLEPAAQLINTLERSCAGLVVLATSREGLGVDGERIIPTPSLAAPPADAALETIAEADAVRLFVERAAAVTAGFELSDENAPVVGQVCRRLDGVPLAVELAAARVSAMTPFELAERLDRRFQVLAGGRRGAVERHQTLRAAIDWSYDLLNDPERRLLGRLAVFAGGCTLDAAEAVCGGDGIDQDLVFECLARLVAGSLVVAEEHGPQTRYRLLETIRQYGEERLGEAGEADTLRARHAGHYAAFVEQGFEHLHGPEHIMWAGRLSAERDNLLAAWSWAIDVDDIDTAFRILRSVPRGHEGGYQLGLPGEAALGLSGATEHPDYPLALAITAVDAASRGDLNLAEQRGSRALHADKRFHTPADSDVENLVCQARADIAMMRGAFDDAVAYNERAADIARANGNLPVVAVNLAFAAWTRTIAGDPTEAVPVAVEALALARKAEMPYVLITTLLVLGIGLAYSDPEEARACLNESLARSAALGYENANALGLAMVLVSRLDDAPATLGIASRTIRQLHWARQPVWLTSSMNLIARALVVTRPDAAAIIQGAARAITLRTLETPVNSRTKPARPGPTPRATGGLFVEVRRETTRLLTAALGEERLSQLRAEGEAMDDDRAVVYTLDQIAKALTDSNP